MDVRLRLMDVGIDPYRDDTRQDGFESGYAVNWIIMNEAGNQMQREESESRIRHLYSVERLTIRQIAKQTGMSRKKVARLINGAALPKHKMTFLIMPYERLIRQWYGQYPHLKAIQVLKRLRDYGYKGGYTTVKEYTMQFRAKKPQAYHELEFLPGEEAQVDWMQWNMPFGKVYGFVYILSYSRYLYVKFYPRQSLEFFLDGHIEAFREIGGTARTNRYDNLKSVVIKRRPEIVYNSRFLDFARHYGFSTYACTPGRANEKGRVERAIRDLNDFLRVNTFTDMEDLHRKAVLWRMEKNNTIHRTTGKAPSLVLKEERLMSLPEIQYKPYRPVIAEISTTGFVHFDTNRYSLPSEYSGNSCQILAFAGHIEIMISGKKIIHKRLFGRNQKSEHPMHRRRLLQNTPNFKYQRIYRLMKGMDKSLEKFLDHAPGDPLDNAYELFRLLKGISKETLISAVREAITLGLYKTENILNLFYSGALRPQDARLLSINYEGRNLNEYDELI